MSIFRFGGFAAALLLLNTGCDGGQSQEDRIKALQSPAKCTTDKNCAKGFICSDKKICAKGERSAAEKAAADKAEEKTRMDAIAAKKAVKSGEGRLHVRLCPVFKNTPEALATIVATHQKTKKKHSLNLAMVVPDGGWQDEFTFPSLPLGTYDVGITYGIQSRGRPDVVAIKCHKKAKPCRDEIIRELEVVLPKDAPPIKFDKKTKKPIKRPCDFLAE